MPKKQKNQQPTIEDVRTLREQAEGYIFDVISEFESISGLTVTGISISRNARLDSGRSPMWKLKLKLKYERRT